MISQKIKKIRLKLFSESIQKRLGFHRNTRLLIIHADDLGLCHDENLASFMAFEKGPVNSGSVMAPCPGFNEVADYAKKNPSADLGVHVTLTSEWERYRWAPLLPPDEVRSIVDEHGYLPLTTADLLDNYNIEDVKREFRAQINHAIESGIDVTHIDSHMFTAFSEREILDAYCELGEEFNLPVLLAFGKPIPGRVNKNVIILDNLLMADPIDFEHGLAQYYTRVLASITPGLSCLLIHAAYDTAHMRELTGGEEHYGSAWRQDDFEFFTGKKCKQILNENNIRLITWREIRDTLFR